MMSVGTPGVGPGTFAVVGYETLIPEGAFLVAEAVFSPEKPGAGITRGYLDDIVFEVGDPEEHEAAVLQVRRTIGRVRHFDPLDKDALFIWDTMDGAKQLKKIFDIVTLFFGCVAVVTLCLGGIGVMNIMLVSVTERTKEIGIRKSLGARQIDILKQFLVEAVTLAVIGGAVGIFLAWIVGKIVTATFFPTYLSLLAILFALAASGGVGVLSGIVPAWKAARLDPIEALRAET